MKIKQNKVDVFKFVVAFGILLCLASIIVFCGQNIGLSSNEAKAADEPLPPLYIGYSVPDTELKFNQMSSKYIQESFYNEDTGSMDIKKYYKIPYSEGGTKWYQAILTDLSINIDFSYNARYEDSNGEIVSDIQNQPFKVNVTPSQGAANSIYAYLISFQVTGKKWHGEDYNGNASDLLEAGVYKITGMTLGCYVGTMCEAHYALKNVESPQVPLTGDGSAPYLTETSVVFSSPIDILVTANLELDSAQSSLIGLTNNLNIPAENRSYGSAEDLRNLVKLHSQTLPSGNNFFTYSSKIGSYNISNGDVKFFKPFINTGIGNITEQTTNLQGSYPNTTLIGLSSLLTVEWNTGIYGGENNDELILTKIPSNEPINKAGKYYLRITPSYIFDIGYKPLTIVLSGTGNEYCQEFNIEKKKLNVDLVQNIGVTLRFTKEYDQDTSAASLFQNQNLSDTVWSSIGGLDQDYAVLESILSGGMLFSFANSFFSSANIGIRNVTMYISVINLSPSDTQFGNPVTIMNVLNNYVGMPGRIVSEEFTPYTSEVDTNGYIRYPLTGFTFRIVPPGVGIYFDSMEFSGSFDYGDYLFPSEFSYQRYTGGVYYNSIKATNTVINQLNGLLNVNNLPSWQLSVLADSTKMKTDAAKNTVYIIPKVGRKLLPEDTQHIKVFTDINGQDYYAYSGRLYAANDYYIYFDIYAYFSTGNNVQVMQNSDYSFSIPKEFGSSEATITLYTDALLNLRILRREILITVNECVVEKNYDGNKNLTAFSASPSNIIASDAVMVELGYNAQYNSAGVGNNIPLSINYFLKARPGFEDQDLDNLILSYNINTINYTNNSGVSDITKGKINPLPLQIKFVRTNYSRKYNQALFVVVRVATAGTAKFSGVVLPKDLYYYYGSSVDEAYNGLNGYCYEDELSAFGIDNYVLVEISGFMQGEGFRWDETNTALRSFMTDMSSDEHSEIVLNTSGLFSWYDTVKNVEINKTTNASTSESDLYRLEFSDGLNIAPNYVFNPANPQYGYLFIEKLTPDADVIIVEGENANNYMEYTGTSNIDRIIQTGKVKYNNHKEYLEITEEPSELISVIDFTFSCTDPEHDHSIFNLSHPGVVNLTLSGVYTLIISLPATTNYLPVSMEFELTVHAKIVNVYLTKAVRVYGESEVVYDINNPKYITDIDQYRYMIDSESGNIVEENGNVVYIYNENGEIVEGNFVLYQGLISGDYFGSDASVDTLASVSVNPGTTNAGIFTSAIEVSGACKHNYTFNYYPTTLYVLRKELSIQADPVQEKAYTGYEMHPNYTIIGGTGDLAMYKIGRVIDGEEIYDEVEDETDTSIVEVGIYIIKVYAKPRSDDEVNYKMSDERLQIIFTILEQEVVLIAENISEAKEYDGEYYDLGSFNQYFTGTTAVAQYSWGYVFISYAVKAGGLTVYQALDALGNPLYLKDSYNNIIKDGLGNDVPLWDLSNSGEYTLTVTAIITNSTNTYFSDGEGGKIYTCEFSISLEITKSTKLDFIITTSEGVNSITPSISYDAAYELVYNGSEAVFNYLLFAGGMDCSAGEIPVTSAIEGILYSYNNNIYVFGAPEYNHNDASSIPNKISSISYNNILNRRKLLNVGSYQIKFFINSEGSSNYNANYTSLEFIYELIVVPAKLTVYIDFEEGYGPYKIYGQDNAMVEEHVIYRYSGWIGDEGDDLDILGQIIPPTIDWSDVGDNPVAGDHYFIKPIGGTAPSNYIFDDTSPSISFVVKKAESWIIVYGFYNAENQTYSDYSVYSGEKQQPNVIRMAGTNPIDTEVEAIGEDGIKIVLEGGFIGQNKNNILPKDIDTSVNMCQDTGKYVFSISVIASTNYNAVPKAYFYYEIVKAELDMVFVMQEFDGENYTVTEVRGYSSKVYDGDNSDYPTFTIQYKGFVGEDDTVNSYKNVLKVMHINQLVYVIVGEKMYQTFEKNFVSVSDGQGKYIRDALGNYIMLYEEGNYIKDSAGNYISVTSIKGNYYKDGEDYKYINGTHIKDYDNDYLYKETIQGRYILDENDTFVLINEVQGKYVLDTVYGNYIDINDTYMLTENNVYVNINDLVAVYYKDESGSFIKVSEAVGNYIRDIDGNYINIALAQGNYTKNEADEFVQVASGEGEYILDEDGNYLLVASLEGKYVRNYEGQYFDLASLTAVYVKDKDGRYFVLSDLAVCPFIKNEGGNYVRASYLTDLSDKTILFARDVDGHYIDCANIIGTHILSEDNEYIKVRTYQGNLLTFFAPYVQDENGDFQNFADLSPNYIKDVDGNYYAVADVELQYIRNSVGDYLKVSENLGENIKDENGAQYIVTENDAKYFCDENGLFLTREELRGVYFKEFGGGYIKLYGDYIRLENFDYVKVEQAVANYVKDSNGNFIKIKDESGNVLNGVFGNYIINAAGEYAAVGEGLGTHILDENGKFVRVNANYNLNYDGIEKLGLVNPVYEIFDESGAILPVNVNIYNIRMAKASAYGYSKNYNINVQYDQVNEQIFYPELEITKRPIDVTYSNTMVTKTYDGYTRIPDGAVTNSNYLFKKVMVEGVEIENSGLIEGDIVNLRYNSSLSSFIRKDVFDIDGSPTQNYVKLYGYNIDNSNYVLQASEILTDDNGMYIRLLANITPASANIRFIDENGKNITNRLELVYDAESHAVNAVVQGVKLDDSSYETISYSIKYFCANSNYDSFDPPMNAETYIVTLTINELNYVSTQKIVDLVIHKATVDIVFGGDIIGTYGSIVRGLSAEARGVGGYSQILQVLYYDNNGKNIPDITAADAGAYEAIATHQESTNFRLSSETESFTVKRRDMSLYYGLRASYSYSGNPVSPDVYFMYNGIKQIPKLMFEFKSGNSFVPYNYGESAVSSNYPKDAGTYRVKAINDLQNFNIVDNYWTEFNINPINLIVGVADTTVLSNSGFGFSYVFEGAISGESASVIFTKEPSFRYYSASDNSLLAERPTNAGLYRVEAYGAESNNYILSYRFGMLAINNSKLFVGDNTETGRIVVDGSFAADITLLTREINNANYSTYITSFDVFKLSNPDYSAYNIAKIFYLSLSDGSVKSADNGELFIKLYVPELFNTTAVANAKENSKINLADDEKYSIAHINSQGEIEILEAYRDGDYLCFYSSSLEVFCILTTDTISSGKNDDWILYVSISIGVVLVAVALIMVRKRA
ncbi:MAG: hypothetical protein EOM87_00100 [Clostridia bacterium]|nr:hypothetical protein [Clostridia bacterium]